MQNPEHSSNRLEAEIDRRGRDGSDIRVLGQVVACDGSRVTISCVSDAGDTSLSEAWSVAG